MPIIGIGIDICDNRRINSIIEKFGDKFLNKVFSQSEITSSNNNKNYFSKRFAAKEALVKALGVGFNGIIKKNEVAILNTLHGKPYIELYFDTKAYIEQKYGNIIIHVSLSDEKIYSVANIIIEI